MSFEKLMPVLESTPSAELPLLPPVYPMVYGVRPGAETTASGSLLRVRDCLISDAATPSGLGIFLCEFRHSVKLCW